MEREKSMWNCCHAEAREPGKAGTLVHKVVDRASVPV